MLVIEVQLLAGRYVATAYNDSRRRRVEWPPHPARLYSAMVAALHDCDPCDEKEREVLTAIENAGSPEIEASNVEEDGDVGRRTPLDVFVPVNDTTVLDHDRLADVLGKISAAQATALAAINGKDREGAEKKLQKERAIFDKLIAAPQKLSDKDKKAAVLLIERRGSPQSRTFPSFSPDRSIVRFSWPTLDLDQSQHDALSSLLERVTRLGHSSSLVHCALAEKATSTLVPAADDEAADMTLRAVGEGQLQRLVSAFRHHQGIRPRVLPSRPQRYRVVSKSADRETIVSEKSIFADTGWVILACEGSARPEATRCVDMAKALHRTLVALAPQPPAEFISGRGADGLPSESPHVAIIPLPDVGHEHAHGGVLGVAIVLPRCATGAERDLLQRILARWEVSEAKDQEEPPLLELRMHGGLIVPVRRAEDVGLRGLRARTWCRPARRWVTATPIALDRNPGNLRSRNTAAAAAEEAKRIIGDACQRVGLPRPLAVEVSLVPLLVGGAPVSAFAPFPREAGRLRRVRIHAELIFENPVCGPVLLGAGRYVGLGLCRPVE